MTRAGRSAEWLNELHADFLVRDRLEEARRAAAHRHLLETLPRRPRPGRRRVAAAIASLGRWLRSLL
ncbi:MAG: hypothetical protein DMD87_20240 [Candidatus Rokuibacteriota bacterium]|nr:MAG: hypothetical protein DMD87_20240 [Candidatus Rokubacteria bacterium]